MGKKDTFNVGDFVFAKVKGYRPWPAKILTAVSKKHSVYFYGTKEVGKNIKPVDLWPYRENKERYSKGGALKQQFEDAINQIEEAIKGNDSCPSPTEVFQNLNASIIKQEEVTLNESQIEEDNVNDVTAEEQPEVPEEVTKPQTMETEIIDEVMKEPEPVLAPIPVTKPTKKETKRAAQVKKEPLKEKEKVQKVVVNDATMESTQEDKPKTDDMSTNEMDQENDKNFSTRGTRKGKGEKRTMKVEVADEIPAKKANTKKNSVKEASSTNNVESMDSSDGKEEIADPKKKELLILECRLCVTIQDIKVSLSLDKPDPVKCIELLETLKKILPEVTPMMIKKNPTVVETMKRLKRYVGNTINWKLPRKELNIFQSNATKIRQLSGEIYDMLKEKFEANGVQSFWEIFAELVSSFQEQTKTLSEDFMAELCYEEELQ